jgi:medium-chain acyl-[acyl-carrier-protein] hydrolase
MNKSILNTWIPYRRMSSHSRLRLFCFPYGGGSASVFIKWLKIFPLEIDICPIQYPGREKRIDEPQFTSLSLLIDALANVLLPELNIPFAFFGHSLGALIGFELARRLRKNRISPEYLFVSGYCAPSIIKKELAMHVLPDLEFIEELRNYSGTPESVLENRELMELLLPAIRADFAIKETYIYSPSVPLNCPISAFGGTKDLEVNRNDLELWKEQTTNRFQVRMFPGNHFYIHKNAEELAASICEDLAVHLTTAKNDPFTNFTKQKYIFGGL